MANTLAYGFKKQLWLILAITIFVVVQGSFNYPHSKSTKVEVRAIKTVDFIDSIGVEVRTYPERNDILWTETIEPRLRELGVRHIRTNISQPGISLKDGSRGKITADRLNRLATLDPPIKTTGILREFGTWESKQNAIKYLQDSLEAIEAPNEPNRRGEGFDYFDANGLRHGYYDLEGDGEKEVVEQGWVHGVSLFMEDLYTSVKKVSDLKVLSFSPTVSGYEQVAEYQRKQDWRLEDWIDYGNFHIYRNNLPERVNLHLNRVRATMYPTKPLIVTETGYSTSKEDWANVPNEQIQATYNLRTLLELFSLNVKRTYIFSLLRLKHGRYFSLLDPDDLESPVYEPKTSFDAIRDTISILTGGDSNFDPGVLHYELINESNNNVNNLNLKHNLVLQKSDGRFYLILWLAIPYRERDRNLNLKFKVNNSDFEAANIYQPITNGSKIVSKIAQPEIFNSIEVKDQPSIIELIPNSHFK